MNEISVDNENEFEIFLPSIWSPLDKYLCLHPKYRSVFNQTVDQLFYGRGSMTASDRHFVALMAASRHHCHFLMDLHAREFQRLGGQVDWLKGLQYVPHKISSLDTLNKVLAHQPWTVSIDHLSALTKCRSQKNWSISELVQVAIVLSQTHVLCSFVLGTGGIEPHDVLTNEDCDISWTSYNGQENGRGNEVEVLLKKMSELKELARCAEEEHRISEREKQLSFLDAHNDQTASTRNSTIVSSHPASNSPAENTCDQYDSLFSSDMNFSYVDFANRSNAANLRTLKIHDISWEDHGYSCVDDLYNEVADMLDQKFTLTQNLTYFTMGSYSDVDTSKYRTAIWMYIQCLYGIRHDDYDYAEINAMVNRETKTFIKTVCCFPDRTTAKLRRSFMTDFEASEKVHVLLMIMEARLQAELLYFCRALLHLNNASLA